MGAWSLKIPSTFNINEYSALIRDQSVFIPVVKCIFFLKKPINKSRAHLTTHSIFFSRKSIIKYRMLCLTISGALKAGKYGN
jgi:hypothetical protein